MNRKQNLVENVLGQNSLIVKRWKLKIHGKGSMRKYEINQLTVRKMKFSVKDFFSKCEQILRKQKIRSHLLKKSLTESFILLQ